MEQWERISKANEKDAAIVVLSDRLESISRSRGKGDRILHLERDAGAGRQGQAVNVSEYATVSHTRASERA